MIFYDQCKFKIFNVFKQERFPVLLWRQFYFFLALCKTGKAVI